MKIVHIVPGSGGTFYCQNCLRDAALVGSLRRKGHDAAIVPMYLPLLGAGSDAPVFYGAISTYVKQLVPVLRRAPRSIDRLLDAPLLLNWAARKGGSTRAAGLEGLTLSMLRGEEGRQAAELERLIDWLEAEGRPDAVHLSNALLLGLARRIKARLDVPVVCTLQDEDVWLDAMRDRYREQAWELMADRARDVDAFVAVSRTFGDSMRERLRIPGERMHVVYLGVDPELYRPAPRELAPPTIGFLSRFSQAQGLDILVDAFLRLKHGSRFGNVRLRLAGGSTGDDAPFMRNIARRLEAEGARQDVDIVPGLDDTSRCDFLASLSVLSVPIPKGEAFGLFMIESMAAGVPVVQPRVGAFAELIELSGGGITYEPNDAETLARRLGEVLENAEQRQELAANGLKAVRELFSVDGMAARTLEVYERAVAAHTAARSAPDEAGPRAAVSWRARLNLGGGRQRQASPEPGQGLLMRLTQVSKTYDQGDGRPARRVLDDLSLALPRGAAVAVVGPSGCGKSTLLNMMGALDRPSSGSVTFKGRQFDRLSEAELARIRNREIGFIFQLHHLLPQCTVLENVVVPSLASAGRVPDEVAARAEALLEQVGLRSRVHARPSELSGGERQRVAVVRALVHEPELVLADEPTGSLDRAAADELGDLLARLQQEQTATLVVVTHSEALAARMQQRYELRDGKLREMP